MKLAVFTSLNPVRSGISDYAEALLPHVSRHFETQVFIDDYEAHGFGADSAIKIRNWREYRPGEFDATLYHVGNNPYHIYMYDTLRKHPGIVVLHEFNLHHLIADSTIKLGNWEGYLQEVEYNGGPEALAYAQQVRAGVVAPDFEGLAMNRRVLEAARALIVHSRFMVDLVRRAGFQAPVSMIPHGVRIPEVHRNGWRSQLGIDESTPLIGTFGFIRPHKRIGECLLAMKRLVQFEPRARMIVVGEEHPHFPVRELIAHLGLEKHVRVMGYVPIEELEGWLSAVDICLNLRYPTVGESSGTLSRALGLGRAVIVSDVGSFSELPDDVCLKVPVGDEEEHLPIGHRPLRIEEITSHTPMRAEVDLLTEYLTLLVTRPEVREAMGARAREYVADQWNWSRVGDLYADWIRQIAAGPISLETSGSETAAREVAGDAAPADATEDVTEYGRVAVAAAGGAQEYTAPRNGSGGGSYHDAPHGHEQESQASPVPAAKGITKSRAEIEEYILGFCAHSLPDLAYVRKHFARLVRTIEITPPGAPSGRILEMGAYLHITPALKTVLGYGEVRGCYLGAAGRVDHRTARSASGEEFDCEIDLFDAEKDVYPYSDGSFSTIICCELLEHLAGDPMHMMTEINRVLKPGGHLVLSTPNICSARALQAVLLGYHPGFFSQYVLPGEGESADPRHSREYAPREVYQMFEAAGFAVERIETGPYSERPSAEFSWLQHLMKRYKLPDHLREDVIHVVGKKMGPVKERHPGFLYDRG